MKVRISEVESILVKAASKFVSKEEAEYFAQEQIDTHLKKCPRNDALESAVSDLKSWASNPASKMEIQIDKPGSLLLNFNKLGPSVKIKYIHDELAIRAKQNGIAMVGVNNSNGFHTLNLWTDGLAKRDLIGLAMFNGGPDGVVPFGGTRGLLGTNPISYAVPTQDRPIIVDMATSEIPYFEIRNAKKNNLPLRPNSAVDGDGKPTSDPHLAMDETGTSNLLPMGGGYKGYALVLLIEVLTGSLVKSFLSTEMSDDYIPEEHGGLVIAIDVGSLTNIDTFKKSVSEMCNEIRAQKPAIGLEKITVPGDRSYERLDQALASGEMEIEEGLWQKLNSY